MENHWKALKQKNDVPDVKIPPLQGGQWTGGNKGINKRAS